MIVHAYSRFSDPSQAGGDSLRRQREAAAEFCKRRGWTLSSLTFHDAGRSGFKGNKQSALNAFLSAIDDGRVKPGETLLVEAVDRLSRKGVRATQTLVNRILDAGIDIAILVPVEKIYRAGDRNDIGGAIELAAFAYQASVYSENLSSRIKSFNQQAKREYKNGSRSRISSVGPSWLTWDGKRYKPKRDAVRAIRHIFQRTIDGIGRKQLLKELNAKFPPITNGIRRNCHCWNETIVSQIIRGRAVLGDLHSTVTGETFKRYYPAIISESTWKQANIAAARRRQERRPPTGTVNLFNGLLFHAIDGCAMGFYQYQKRDKRSKDLITRYRRYKSYHATHGVKGASPETIDVDRFEDLIFRFLPNLELGSGRRDDYSKLTDERDLLNIEIESLQTQIKNRSGSAVTLGPVLADLSEKLADVEKRLSQTERKSIEPTQAYRVKLARMRRGTLDERRSVRDAIRRIVSRIEVLPVKMGSQRRDRVRSMVEIQFKTGEYVRAVELPDDRLVQVSGPRVVKSLSEQVRDGFRFSANDYAKLVGRNFSK